MGRRGDRGAGLGAVRRCHRHAPGRRKPQGCPLSRLRGWEVRNQDVSTAVPSIGSVGETVPRLLPGFCWRPAVLSLPGCRRPSRLCPGHTQRSPRVSVQTFLLPSAPIPHPVWPHLACLRARPRPAIPGRPARRSDGGDMGSRGAQRGRVSTRSSSFLHPDNVKRADYRGTLVTLSRGPVLSLPHLFGRKDSRRHLVGGPSLPC